MLRNYVETPINNHLHNKLLLSFLHSAKILENKAKSRKKEAKEAANN
jgi:hypothetical protein